MRIILAGDHQLFCEGVRMMLETISILDNNETIESESESESNSGGGSLHAWWLFLMGLMVYCINEEMPKIVKARFS